MSSYLLQKPSGWYFRYVLPHRLRAAVQRREFRFALHTRHRREAKRRATLAFASVQRLLAYLEQHGMPLTPDQIQRLVAEHVRRCVAEIEDAHFSRKRPVDPDESEERLESLDEFDVMLREQIGRADYAPVATAARELLKEQGIELGLEDVDFNRLCDAILQAGFKIHDHERKLLLGLPRSPLTPATLTGPASAGSPAPAQLICTRTVSDLQGEFIQDRLSARQFGDATAKDYEATLAELVEHLGDRNPDEYSKTELNTHRDILFRLPKHRRKSPKYRDAPLAQLLEQDVPSSDLRSETTVAEAIRRISTFFNWCKAMEFCEKNNAETVTVNAEKKQRDAFTPEELHAIFHSDFYVKQQYNRFYRYWTPLLGLFTGARVSELCQLTVDDVKQDGDVHYLDIVSDQAKGKRTKTAAGVRRIPIHSQLIALGFLEYVEWLRSTGQERVLVDAPLSGGRPGAKVSDWFRNFRTSLGLTREGLVLHSLRHNANTAAFKAGNNPAAIQQVIGHKKAGLGISNNYLHDIGLENAAAVIESLDYGVDVSHLKNGWKALAGKKA